MKKRDQIERQTYTVSEFQEVFGLGKNAAYNAIHRKQVASIRLGGKILIPKSAVERLLTEMAK